MALSALSLGFLSWSLITSVIRELTVTPLEDEEEGGHVRRLLRLSECGQAKQHHWRYTLWALGVPFKLHWPWRVNRFHMSLISILWYCLIDSIPSHDWSWDAVGDRYKKEHPEKRGERYEDDDTLVRTLSLSRALLYVSVAIYTN